MKYQQEKLNLQCRKKNDKKMRIDQVTDPVQRERQLDYNRAIAQKIRNRLQQLENVNEKDKRRWIWELLQNAKDTISDRKVDIEIITDKDFIEFKHNGGFFSPRDVSNLINQISSKEGKDSIGRFGTGFLTTHTLSRLVNVKSVFTEDDIYYSFEILLDRNGSTEPELVEAIEKSWASYKPEIIEKPKQAIYTSFQYINPDFEAAAETIKDFETFIHFNLAFVQGIGKITIKNNIENYQTSFELLDPPKEVEERIFIFSFLKDKKQIDLLIANDDIVNIAIEISKTDDKYRFLPIAKNIPRIFCAFPLIGTESFYFPFVLNSKQFIPKTERDKLYLKGETKDADKNKEILIHAVDLYERVVQFASENNWKDFFVIADAKLPKEDDDLDRNWYQKNIQKRIREYLVLIPIVETEKGKLISILNSEKKAICYFPYDTNTEIREKIWEFTNDLFSENLPRKSDIHNWYSILWSDCYYQKIETIAEDVQSFENIDDLSNKLNLNTIDTYKWLNKVNLFFEQEKKELFDEFKVLPNQYGIFKLKKDLYEDKNIPDELKEVIKQLGSDWKDDLLHKSNKIGMSSYRTVYAISEAINATIRENELDFTDEEFNSAIYQLVSYSGKDLQEIHTKIWEFSKAMYNEQFPKKITQLENTDKFNWSDSLNWIINKLVVDISELANIQKFGENLTSIYEPVDWLNNLLLLIQQNEKFKHLLESDEYAIIPNQYGDFKFKDELYEDKNIPDELKEIYKELGTDWKNELLHKNIKIQISSYRTVANISDAINSIIRKNNFDFSDDRFKKIIFKLIAFTNNEQLEKHKKIWEFSRTFYFDKIPEKLKVLENTDKFDWTDSLEWQVNKLVVDISELKYVDVLDDNIHGATRAIEWLKDFIDFLQKFNEYKYLLDSEEYPILPNQNGWFYPKSQLYLDDGTIDTALKEALRPINSEWLDELLDTKIYLELPSNRERSFEDIATEIDVTFRNYPTADRETQEFKIAFKHLYDWFQEQDEEKLKTHFDWTYRNMAVLYLSTVGDKEQKKDVLSIAASGNSHLFSKIAKNKTSIETLEYIANNPEKVEEIISSARSGTNAVSKKFVLDEKLEDINKKLNKNFSSIDEFVNDYLAKNKKIDFMDEPIGDSKFVDMQAIKASNENARQAIFDYLRKIGYDVDGWTKMTNTIISGVKKDGVEITVITKGVNNGSIYFNDKEKEILKNKKGFSELWVQSNDVVFEINLGKIIEMWDTKVIKANMFDFR